MKKRKESVEEEAVGDYWRASALLRVQRCDALRKSLKLADPLLMQVQVNKSEEFLKAVLGPAYDGGSASNFD